MSEGERFQEYYQQMLELSEQLYKNLWAAQRFLFGALLLGVVNVVILMYLIFGH